MPPHQLEAQSSMDNQERIHQLNKAEDYIHGAIFQIEQAVEGTKMEGEVEAFLLSTLQEAINEQNQYTGGTNPANLQYLKNELAEQDK